MISLINQACCHPKCPAKHLEDPILAWIYQLTPAQLTELYANALGEILLSLRDDADHGRYASYFTRLRGSMECYMRGLWAGLVATPLEIVHDASGEHPILLLEKLSNIVFSRVLGKQSAPSLSFTAPIGGLQTVSDLLNTTAHMTAYILAFSACATPELVMKMNSGLNTLIEGQLKTLRKVARLLKEGKTQREIVSDIRRVEHP
jgi:hypothetical protein